MDAHQEKSLNVFSHEVLDRKGELRGDLSSLEGDFPACRVVPVWRSRNLIAGDIAQDKNSLHAVVLEQCSLIEDPQCEAIFLGVADGARYFAIDLSNADDPAALLPAGQLPKSHQWVDLRMVGQLLTDHDASVLVHARAMCTWHRRHAYCGKCGSATRFAQSGHQRVCSSPACGYNQFPRTDPAVIVLVTRGDQVLLARQADWPENSWSIVAGFVEPGESLEAAVRREVMEETGVIVDNVRYHSSQPWPFPQSIMLGFWADAQSEAIDLKDGELEQARWFSRSELDELVAARQIRLSRPVSISHRLIAEWRRQGADGT